MKLRYIETIVYVSPRIPIWLLYIGLYLHASEPNITVDYVCKFYARMREHPLILIKLITCTLNTSKLQILEKF